jgi:hypothetical protein
MTIRGSALWGKKEGGDSRGSALWGKGARGAALLLAAVALFAFPAVAVAKDKDGPDIHATVPQDLLDDAQANPKSSFDVIVQGDGSVRATAK